MRHVITMPLAVLLLALVATPFAAAQQKKEPLVEQVKTSIQRGVKFLRDSQRPDGSWEVNLENVAVQGGWTSLAVLALLNAGVPVIDRTVAEGLAYLRRLEPSMTYVRALQTMVFVEAAMPEDRERIRGNIDWLIKARVIRNDQFIGWSYQLGPANTADNSNTQYALLGLWAGRQAGIEIKREIWQSIREFYLSTQGKEDGGWSYSPVGGAGPQAQSSLTMTTAGLCGLLIAGMELNVGREKIDDKGVAANCGLYQENKAISKALSWIGTRFSVNLPQRAFYNLYGIERAGRLSGLRFLGGHDWYREGCQYLVGEQRDDGSWKAQGAWDKWPVVSTSFALLFLSKGRTPVLVSKLVHGAFPRQEADADWNNDRNDLRHLVDFSSKKLFNNLPLAWQTFDIMRGGDDEEETISDLLQSPVLYFNGHKSPLHRFTHLEKKILQRYIDNGGFLFVEACCGHAQFDQGFKQLAAEL